jgi:hypothetical protein
MSYELLAFFWRFSPWAGPPHPAGQFHGLAGAEFVAAVAGNAFFLIQAGDLLQGKRLGRAMLDADFTPGAQVRPYLQLGFDEGAIQEPIQSGSKPSLAGEG